MKLFEQLFSLLNITKTANREFHLTFEHEDNDCWYIVLPNWKANHANLQMVAGADDLLDELSLGKRFVHITVSKVKPAGKECIELLKRDTNHNNYGTFYTVVSNRYRTPKLWLCPVTLFVLGEYPDRMYIYDASAE